LASKGKQNNKASSCSLGFFFAGPPPRDHAALGRVIPRFEFTVAVHSLRRFYACPGYPFRDHAAFVRVIPTFRGQWKVFNQALNLFSVISKGKQNNKASSRSLEYFFEGGLTFSTSQSKKSPESI